MVDLPRTYGRSVGVQLPPVVQAPGGIGTQTAASFAQAARLLGYEADRHQAEDDAKAIADAREAGASDVTLGPDGRPRLNTVDNSTPANRARRAAAIAAYEARSEDQWNNTAVTLRGQAAGDADKFMGLWQASQQEALDAVPPELRANAETIWSRLGARHQTDMLRDQVRQDDTNNRAALSTGLTMARQRLWDLADLGQRDGPVWADAQSQYNTAINRLRTAGLMNPEQERQERDLASAEGEARTISARTVQAVRGPQGTATVPPQFRTDFDAATRAAGLSPEQASVFAGLVTVESGWNPTARNPASGARGLTQIIPSTAANPGFGMQPVDYDQLDNPGASLTAGARYFKAMLDQNGGNMRAALRDYNAGIGQADPAMRAAGERYATKVLAAAGQQAAVVDQLDADLTALRLPEERRNRVLAQARGDLARVDAERRIALQDVSLQAQDLHARLSAGYDIPPDALFGLARRANELGDSVLSARLAKQAEVQGTLVAARRLPMPMLQEALAQATERAGQEGADGTSAALADGYRRLIETKQRGLKEDALAYGVRIHSMMTGPLTPIDWSNPDTARLTLSDRVQQARRIGELEGVRALPLTSGEIANLKEMASEGTPLQRQSLLGTLANGLPPEHLRRVLRELDQGGERTQVFAVAAGQAAAGRPGLAEEILRGDDALRTNDASALKKPEFARQVEAEIGNAMAHLPPAARGALITSVRALVADRAARAGRLTEEPRGSDVEQATRDITGGVLEWNGQKILAPSHGMEQADLNRLMRALPPDRLVGAFTDAGQPLKPEHVARNSTLLSVGDGRYRVQVGGKDVVDGGGRAFVLDLRDAVPVPPSARPAPQPGTPAASRRPNATGAQRIEGYED